MEQIIEIYADKIIEPVDPMRSDMDSEKINDLAASIRQQGLIQPLTVRPVGEKFEIVAGHRRFKACLIAGVIKIPCIIKAMSDEEVFAVRAHENLFRDDINPVDEAIYIGKLIGEDNSKIPEIARQLNRSVAWVEDRLEILMYPDYFLPAVKNNKIKLGVAKHLAAIGDDVYRKMFFDSAVSNGMAIWQAEYYLRQYEAGVFKEGTEVIPPDNMADRPRPAAVRAPCARCGGVAEEPNLKNVFIHIECPSE